MVSRSRPEVWRMIPERLRPPLSLQIASVVILLTAALGTLWVTSSSVVRREERRARTNARLQRAGEQLRSLGRDALAEVRPYPEYMGTAEWAAIDGRLAAAARLIREQFPNVECGFYIPDRRERPFVPALPGGEPADRPGGDSGYSSPQGRNLYDDVETQADAAYRKRYGLLVVEDVPPDTVAIQAAPIRVGGRVVASAWTMTRLGDPIFLDRAATGYRLFAGLALAGIILSLGLTFRLVRTVRRQAVERDRLQRDLRRSERLAALGKLLAGVAHEVRNPLAGIRSTAQLWRRGLGIGAESLDGLVQEVDRLEEIVSGLLQFSRADAQDLAPGDLNALMSEVARLATGPAESRGVRVELDLDGGAPPVGMAPSALLQVFRNLTTNAVQAMPEGGVILLKTRHDASRRRVVAEVADTGPGLSEEAIGHLFEPFFTTKAEGTGLGLAIAREIALAHRGDLRASNRPEGSGAVFALVLPADLSETAGGPR